MGGGRDAIDRSIIEGYSMDRTRVCGLAGMSNAMQTDLGSGLARETLSALD